MNYAGAGTRFDLAALMELRAKLQLNTTKIDAISASDRLFDRGTVQFSGSNVTVGTTTNSSGNVILISGNASLPSFSAGASTFGNTAGSTGMTGTRLVLVGTNNVTLSQSTDTAGATLSISGQPAFSAGVSNVGNTAGSTGVSGTRMVLVGTNGVTLSQSTNTAGATVSISAGGGGFSGGVSNLGNTAGSTGVTGTRMVLVGTNNISLSQSTDANGATVSISGGAGAGAFAAGVSTIGNTSGTTGTVNAQLVLVGVGGVRLTQSSVAGGSATVTFDGAEFQAGMSTDGNTAGLTGVTNNRALHLVGSGMISLSGTTTGGAGFAKITINATQSVQTQDVLSVGVSTGGNTLGNTTVNTGSRFVLVGTNGVTLSQGTAAGATTISLSGNPAFSMGVSTGGNTSGSTGVTGTRVVLAATNGITLSQSTDANGASITISGPGAGGAGFSAGMSNLGNTAGTSGTVSNQLVLVGSNNITLSGSTAAGGATISISGGAGGGGGGVTLSRWPSYVQPIATSSMNSGTTASTGGSSQTTASFYCAPIVIDETLTFNSVQARISLGTVAGTGSMSAGHLVGLYTLNGGTALSLVSSFVFNLALSQNSVTAYSGRWYWGTNSTSNSSSLGGNVSASFTGLRPVPLSTGAASLSAGDYWLVHGMTHRTSGASIGGINSAAFLAVAGSTTANLISAFGTNVGVVPLRFMGVLSSTSNATTTGLLVMPSSINTSVLTGTGGTSQWQHPLINIQSA